MSGRIRCRRRPYGCERVLENPDGALRPIQGPEREVLDSTAVSIKKGELLYEFTHRKSRSHHDDNTWIHDGYWYKNCRCGRSYAAALDDLAERRLDAKDRADDLYLVEYDEVLRRALDSRRVKRED